MVYSIELLPDAEIDIEDAVIWYNDISESLKSDFLQQLRIAVLAIQAKPLLYQKIKEGCRKLNLARFPYKVIYRVEQERILVIAVAHHKRSNKHWISRK